MSEEESKIALFNINYEYMMNKPRVRKKLYKEYIEKRNEVKRKLTIYIKEKNKVKI